MADVIVSGLAATDPVPGVYLEINFAQGASSGNESPYEVVILANKTSAGSATVGTEIYGPDSAVPLQTEAQAIALFGPGSEAHCMFREFTKTNTDSVVRVVLVADAAGVAATGTFTVATTSTGTGTIACYVNDEFCEASIASGDTVTAIAAAIVASINSKSWLPVTASNALGVVTLTAKNTGPRGNSFRFQPSIRSVVSIATTVSVTVDTAFSSGATQDTVATALATILPSRLYYIVPAHSDATNLGLIKAQVDAQSAPTIGIRQRVVAGICGTAAAAITVATGLNSERIELVHSESSPMGSARVAAKAAAVYSLEELPENPRTNFAGYGNDAVSAKKWNVPGPRTASTRPSRTVIKTLLLGGVSPIACNPNGSTYLVNRVTTRTLAGALADYRISRSHKVSICDWFSDDLIAKTIKNYPGAKIADDPRPGARAPGERVVTPKMYKGAIFRLLDDYADLGLIQNVDEIKAGTEVSRQVGNRARMGVRIPLQTIDNWEQTAIAVDQVA